jgi:L,D-peptidoglycan transpeptidase YkuD (ErfK/YbiS/YcfS/YnhG family)
MACVFRFAAVGILALALVAVVTPETAAAQVSPDKLSVSGSTQVITVTSTRWRTSYATVQAWEKKDGRWVRALPEMRARIGRNGFVKHAERLQNSGTTPAGNYRITRTFGLSANPGTSMPYRDIDGTDWWPYDPRDPWTYNTLQPFRSEFSRWRTSEAEHLSAFTSYKLAAVINYNLPSGVYWDAARREHRATVPADVRKGGGIFLHVNGTGATAGCVSVYGTAMRKLLLWLDPDAKPRIVMGPRDWLPTL